MVNRFFLKKDADFKIKERNEMNFFCFINDNIRKPYLFVDMHHVRDQIDNVQIIIHRSGDEIALVIVSAFQYIICVISDIETKDADTSARQPFALII